MQGATRAHLGLITPRTNSVNEREWRELLPAGVSLAVTRMDLHLDADTPEGQRRLDRDLDSAMAELARADAEVMIYACTAGTMVVPARSLPEAMSARTGRACVTTAAAIVDALRTLRVRRIAVATPYHDALNDHERHFLEAHGFEVVAIAGLGIGAGGPHQFVQIAGTPPETVEDHVARIVTPDAEAVLVSCTDFPTLTLLERLEDRFGRPVISSNTATLWAALRAASLAVPIRNAGRLLSGGF